MPYKSAKQRAYMHIHEPEIAKRWDAKYGGGLDSLARKRSKKKKPRRRGVNR
jgi:hypothetical protein